MGDLGIRKRVESTRVGGRRFGVPNILDVCWICFINPDEHYPTFETGVVDLPLASAV
jgi:hypothetical protein